MAPTKANKQEESSIIRSFLSSKFRFPALSPNTIERKSLLSRLDSSKDQPITIVSASAGYGKTTLLVSWLNNYRAQVAWYSLDRSDNDVSYFLLYLIKSFQTVDKNIGKHLADMLLSPQAVNPEAVIIGLLNDMEELKSEVYLVFDDYHVISAKQIHDVLSFLVNNLPGNLKLILSSRSDPPLPFARLRSKNLLSEVRASDLRFSEEEIIEFFKEYTDLQKSPNELQLLESITEGWVTGLQLIRLSARKEPELTKLHKSIEGSNLHIADYLVEEVLAFQPDYIRHFLIQTSIVDQLSAPLCDKITGSDNSDAILEELLKSNLLIFRVDDEGKEFRYHKLFSDLLSSKLQSESPSLKSTLHHRAAEWYEENRRIDEAINHYFAGKVPEKAAILLEKTVEQYWESGAHYNLLKWFDLLSDRRIAEMPNLCIYYLWVILANGQVEKSEDFLSYVEENSEIINYEHQASSVISKDIDIEGIKTEFFGKILAIKALLSSYKGESESIIKLAEQALIKLSAENFLWRGLTSLALGDAYSMSGQLNRASESYLEAITSSKKLNKLYFTIISSIKLAVNYRNSGNLELAVNLCKSLIELLSRNGLSESIYAGVSHSILGESYYEQGEIEKAIIHTRDGIQMSNIGYDGTMLSWSYHCYLRVRLGLKRIEEADEALTKIESIIKERFIPPWAEKIITGWRIRSSLIKGDLGAVNMWVVSNLNTTDIRVDGNELEYTLYARYLIAMKKYSEAIDTIHILEVAIKNKDLLSRKLELSVLKSICYYKLNLLSEAQEELIRAIQMALPIGYLSLFCDEGNDMATLMSFLLEDLRADNKTSPNNEVIAYTRRILIHFSRFNQSGESKTGIDYPSPREIEVLKLIAEGLTNMQIAEKLFVSINTIRTHTKNLNLKLGTNSRTQAIAVAKEMGIL